jgi:diguanylate cyclase (GGDEF)-like protein
MTRKNVLTVDNSPMVQRLIAAHLAQEPIDIIPVLSGADALAAARDQRPDLVLLGVQMPKPDGWDVCRMLKSDALTRNIPIIFLTAEDDPAHKIRGLDLGASDYITKPFDPAELIARVRSTLRTKELIDLLSEKAMIDGLTGLRNRAYLDERLETELAEAKRYCKPLSCVMLDIDHFKRFNDQHGHAVGDQVLRHVAAVLRETARAEDVVCRYGGEEFCILLPCVSAGRAVVFAERARAALAAQSVELRGGIESVTASFGVSDTTVSTAAAAVAEALLMAADRAMYDAKRAGRNRIHAPAGPVQPAGAAAAA